MYRSTAFFAMGFAVALGTLGCGGGQTAGVKPEGTGGKPTVEPATDAGMDSGLADPAKCGNGVLDPYEQCDDGNTKNGDGCDANCKYSCVPGPVGDSVCGDGDICNGAETCGDDHTCHPATAPRPDGTICGQLQKCEGGVCTNATPDCGDTLVVPPEECDPPDGAGCTADCRFACVSTDATRNCQTDVCIVGAKCDDTSHTCTAGKPVADLTSCGSKLACISGVCSSKYCGNDTVDPGEECDDGNTRAGDGCEPNCKFSCKAGDATRDCQAPGNCFTSGTCGPTHVCSGITPLAAGTACGTGKNCVSGNCRSVECGDGIVATGVEACDDGNLVNGDGCDNDCTKSCASATASADCPTPPPCRAAACPSSKCETTGSGTGACTTAGGTATCVGGACTSGSCGDGNTDTGEQCDYGTGDSGTSYNGPGTGCEDDCLFSCNTNNDCDPCQPCGATTVNGNVGKKCGGAGSKSDGTSCGTGRICIAGGCRSSICGDGFTDTQAGEQCDPPNTAGCGPSCNALTVCNLTGTAWAMKVVVGVSWGNGALLAAETNQITEWARLDDVNQTNFQFAANLHPCGITIPDFLTTPAVGSEWFGIEFPPATFDAKDIPSFPMTTTLSNSAPGATLTTSTTIILLGVNFTDPATPLTTWTNQTDSWMMLAADPGVATADQDDDKEPGLTAVVKTGPLPSADKPPSTSGNYIDVRTDVQGMTRADALYVAIKQVASQTGTLDSCTTMHGNVTVNFIDNHVIGCELDAASGGGQCGDTQKQLTDGVRPQYTVSSATFTAVAVPPGSTCAAVRNALP